MKPLIVKEIIEGNTDNLCIKMTKIEIRPPRWDPHPEKSKTNNSAWRQGLFPIFNDGEFDWMPHFKDIDLMEKLHKQNKSFFIVFINRREPDTKYYWKPTDKEINSLMFKKCEIDKINSELAKKFIKKRALEKLS